MFRNLNADLYTPLAFNDGADPLDYTETDTQISTSVLLLQLLLSAYC